jgi:hypothetical protein
MDGQTRSMEARKARRTGGWTKISDGIRRRKRQVDKQNEGNFWW